MAVAMPAYQREPASSIVSCRFTELLRSKFNRYAESFGGAYVLSASQIFINLDEHHGIDWHTRCKMVTRICEGWAYLLLMQLEHCIRHFDIKPHNILLDAKMVPKITDFGLSRCFGENIVGTKKIVEYNGRILRLSDKIGRSICFEYVQDGNLVEHPRLDWNTRLKTVVATCGALAYLHEERRIRVCHLDLKPKNILLDDDMVPRITDFGLSRYIGEEQPAGNMRNCIGTRGYKAPEMNGNIISDICIFGLTIMSAVLAHYVDNKATAEEILQEYWRNKQQATQIMWMLESSSKQMKRLNQIVLSCMETGKSTKVTRSTVSSTQRAAHDIIVSDSGVRISATVDVPKMKPSPACMLDSGSSALAPAPSMHRHLSHSNLSNERSNKPLSNRAPATNSSDNTTRAPIQPNKLTDDQAHSDPNSSVDERDTNAEATRSGRWYVATGAAHHATGDRALITNLVEELENDSLCVHAADGTPMPVRGRGNVETDNVVLPDVYYVPGLWTNLVSVGQLAGLDYCVGFSRGACHVSDAAGAVVGTAYARGDGLYEVDHLRVPLGML